MLDDDVEYDAEDFTPEDVEAADKEADEIVSLQDIDSVLAEVRAAI